MKKRTCIILSALLTLAPAALLLAVWRRLPDTIVTTWGVDGAVTGTGGKGTLWWLVGLEALLALLLQLAPRLDPRRDAYRKFGERYDGFCVALLLFFSAVNCVCIWENLRPGSLSIGRLLTGMLGLLLLWSGNVMPTFRHNYFVGIRTPWTLADPRIWERTHRLGGRLYFLCGLLLLPMSLLLPEALLSAAGLALVLAASLTPCVMSYLWWRQAQNS